MLECILVSLHWVRIGAHYVCMVLAGCPCVPGTNVFSDVLPAKLQVAPTTSAAWLHHVQGYAFCCCKDTAAVAARFCSVASDCMLAAAVVCVYASCAQVLLCMTPLMHPPALPSSCSCCTPLCTCQRLSSQVSLAWV